MAENGLKRVLFGRFWVHPGMPVRMLAMARSIFARGNGSGLPSPKIQYSPALSRANACTVPFSPPRRTVPNGVKPFGTMRA